MTRNEHLLTIIMEECAEVIHRASKALRFGLTDVDINTGKTAAQSIIDEMNDLVGVYQMFTEENVTLFGAYGEERIEWLSAMMDKRKRVEHYLKYSAQCGTLTENGK